MNVMFTYTLRNTAERKLQGREDPENMMPHQLTSRRLRAFTENRVQRQKPWPWLVMD